MTKLWDLWCIGTIVGIWPRFIEPQLLAVNHLSFTIKALPYEFDGFKLLHISDLHFNRQQPPHFRRRIIQQVRKFRPDLIVLTGDLLCRAQLEDPDQLLGFLCDLQAPYGCFVTLGNHDYQQYVSMTTAGTFDIPDNPVGSRRPFAKRGLSKLFKPLPKGPYQATEKIKNITYHKELCALLQRSPFQLLENETAQIRKGPACLNICGLGDYWADRCHPEKAFKTYDVRYPGIILSHNPDTVMALQDYAGDLVLSGHTHGAQINLPWIWKKFVGVEHLHLKRGLIQEGNKSIYINRGLGSGSTPFRWFSMPEILCLTLKSPKEQTK